MQSPVRVAQVQPWEVSQSTLLFGGVMVAFLVYLAINGKLATYWALLMGQSAPAGSAAASTAAQPPATQPPVTVLTPQQTPLGTLAGSTSDVLSALNLGQLAIE